MTDAAANLLELKGVLGCLKLAVDALRHIQRMTPPGKPDPDHAKLLEEISSMAREIKAHALATTAKPLDLLAAVDEIARLTEAGEELQKKLSDAEEAYLSLMENGTERIG